MRYLIAKWGPEQSSDVETPRSVRWNDGASATAQDYIDHILDTHLFIRNSYGTARLSFPGIIAEATYDFASNAWRLSGPGVLPVCLPVDDPGAKRKQIIAAIWELPIVYRTRIHRTRRGHCTEKDLSCPSKARAASSKEQRRNRTRCSAEVRLELPVSTKITRDTIAAI
jgi:hypothetical protein